LEQGNGRSLEDHFFESRSDMYNRSFFYRDRIIPPGVQGKTAFLHPILKIIIFKPKSKTEFFV
jgi:hypothetical protein